MYLQDLLNILEAWAPRDIAWERDNVGLQVGSMRRNVRNVLVTLDVTDRVVDEARRKKIDLIISHHPLIFQPLKTLRTEDRTARLLTRLIEENIALYALHTNLDFTTGGVSFALAEELSLQSVRVLQPHTNMQKKIVVYVPEQFAAPVMTAMAKAGAGTIGKYENCSFRSPGVGTYLPASGAAPYAGKIGKLESAEEVRLEMIAAAWDVREILSAMRSAHPYEEVAYDVYDLANVSDEFGAGVIGELEKPQPLKKFLGHVRKQLNVPVLRYTAGSQSTVRRVAVCGGSGSDLLATAVCEGADAFVTADITYHKFQDCDRRLTLVDAGHFETERPALRHVVRYLAKECAARKQQITITASSTSSNFVQYSIA
ncbi:MAG TPA: Nif3-like dinuclear metal center hexameric protein [Bacteroidota bacterium]|nr:Nif3-like dinuclear metal center hexameric protein [Bacteroidota bacterium]